MNGTISVANIFPRSLRKTGLIFPYSSHRPLQLFYYIEKESVFFLQTFPKQYYKKIEKKRKYRTNIFRHITVGSRVNMQDKNWAGQNRTRNDKKQNCLGFCSPWKWNGTKVTTGQNTRGINSDIHTNNDVLLRYIDRQIIYFKFQ